jgi:hypothetical protein
MENRFVMGDVGNGTPAARRALLSAEILVAANGAMRSVGSDRIAA